MDLFAWLMFHICSVTITCSMFLNGKSNIKFIFKILIIIVTEFVTFLGHNVTQDDFFCSRGTSALPVIPPQISFLAAGVDSALGSLPFPLIFKSS